jgi:hypothetical protein
MECRKYRLVETYLVTFRRYHQITCLIDLRIVETFLPSPERVRQELRLYSDLQAPLIATTGYTSSAVERVCHRARELCREMGDGPNSLPFSAASAPFTTTGTK